MQCCVRTRYDDQCNSDVYTQEVCSEEYTPTVKVINIHLYLILMYMMVSKCCGFLVIPSDSDVTLWPSLWGNISF